MAAAEQQEDPGAAKAKLEFGIWRGGFQNSYAAWSSAPQDLKPALLLKGQSLVRAEHWLLAFPEKLSTGEKRYIVRSISQAADGRGQAPEIRIEATRSREQGGGIILLAGVLLAAAWALSPKFLKATMESAINGGVTEEAIAAIRAPGQAAPKLAMRPAPEEPARRPPAAAVVATPAKHGPEPVAAVPSAPGVVRASLPSAETVRIRRLVELAQGGIATGDPRRSALLAVEAVHEVARQSAVRDREALSAPALSSLFQALSSEVVAPSPVEAPKRPSRALVCSNGHRAIAAMDAGAVRAWQLDSRRRLLSLEHQPGLLRGLAIDPGCGLLLVADADDIGEVWSLTTGARVSRLAGHEAALLSAAFSPDGRTVLTASQDTTARLWDAASGRQIAVLAGHDWAVTAAAFSPDGHHAATASPDRTARLWDAASGRLLRVLDDHQGAVTSLVFSPDHRHLLTTSADGVARLWDLPAGTPARILRAERSSVVAARFSEDGLRVATIAQDSRVQVREVESGRDVLELADRSRGASQLAFSPDGRSIATITWDGAVVLWHAGTGREIATLTAPGQRAASVAFAADGQGAIAITESGAVLSWQLPRRLSDAIPRALNGAPECLPEGERLSLGLDAARPAWCDGASSALINRDWMSLASPARAEVSTVPSER
jgi:sugar lactone lactonase YvrE